MEKKHKFRLEYDTNVCIKYLLHDFNKYYIMLMKMVNKVWAYII